jgi:opacity protein-like surface antigen
MNRTAKTVVCAALLFAAALFVNVQGVGQATYTATIDRPPISVFAGGSYVDPQPDFYKNNQTGYVFGIDYTHSFHRFYVDPSIEVRGSISPVDEEVGENVYSGGLKLEHQYRRFHPYGDFLVGSGTIKFNQNNFFYGFNNGRRPDNSIVLTYGGGVDVDVWHNLGLKADYQWSHWNTGGNVIFHPRSANAAVYYRFGFGRKRD